MSEELGEMPCYKISPPQNSDDAGMPQIRPFWRAQPHKPPVAPASPQVQAATQRARKLLKKRAAVAAVASAVPVPGLDWAVDAALLSRVLPQISAEFGLSHEQLDLLDPKKREQVQKAVAVVGSVVIGKLVTRELALKAAGGLGVRMTTRQLSKYIPFAGQVVAATLGYATVRFLGEQHIRDCIKVAQEAQVPLPLAAP